MPWLPLEVDTANDEGYDTGDPADRIDLADLLAVVARRPAWHRHAACRGQVDAFFPTRGQSSDPAKSLCATCPVADDCTAAGMREHFGIWGGLSERQRRNARRPRRRETAA